MTSSHDEAVDAAYLTVSDVPWGGRWIVWGCVGRRRIKVVVRPISRDRCIIVTIIRTGAPCI